MVFIAFTSTLTNFTSRGNKKGSHGTFTNTEGSTGGDINTGLDVCEDLNLTPSGAAVSADDSSVNETLPCAGNAVTIKTTADVDGYWEAWGC